MNESHNLPMVGLPTDREQDLIEYLHTHVANWIETHNTERRELIAAMFSLCRVVFCLQTNFNVKGQCAEIDDFAKFLKDFATRNATSV